MPVGVLLIPWLRRVQVDGYGVVVVIAVIALREEKDTPSTVDANDKQRSVLLLHFEQRGPSMHAVLCFL